MVAVIQTVTLSARAARRLNEGALWFSEQDVIGRKPNIPCVARVFDSRSRMIAQAFISPGSRYYIRVITRQCAEICRSFWSDKIKTALKRRQRLEHLTDAYRVVHSESDGMPSIVIDRYNDVVSLQITSRGAQSVRDDIIGAIEEILNPRAVVERVSGAMFRSDDLAINPSTPRPIGRGMLRVDTEPFGRELRAERRRLNPPLQGGGWRSRSIKDKIIHGDSSIATVREKDMRFEVDVLLGQKTGAYLDYRSVRMKALELAHGRALDAFCYQGWLACQIAGKAASVVAVDSSRAALEAARRNAKINSRANIRFARADAFNYIKNCKELFDFIHMDPPAMAEEHAKIAQAISGYKKLITGGIKLLACGGTLMISSCSHKISERILEETALTCLKKSGRTGAIVWRGIQDIDHPVLKGFPESLYLKALAIKLEN